MQKAKLTAVNAVPIIVQLVIKQAVRNRQRTEDGHCSYFSSACLHDILLADAACLDETEVRKLREFVLVEL